MAILRIALIVVLIAIAIGLLVVGFLPSAITVESEIVIDALPPAVYAKLEDLRKWSEWTVWAKKENRPKRKEYRPGEGKTLPAIDWELSGGEIVTLELLAREKNRGVSYRLLARGGKITMQGAIILRRQEKATRVTWQEKGDVGFVGRLFRARIEESLTEDFSEALARLKAVVEDA